MRTRWVLLNPVTGAVGCCWVGGGGACRFLAVLCSCSQLVVVVQAQWRTVRAKPSTPLPPLPSALTPLPSRPPPSPDAGAVPFAAGHRRGQPWRVGPPSRCRGQPQGNAGPDPAVRGPAAAATSGGAAAAAPFSRGVFPAGPGRLPSQHQPPPARRGDEDAGGGGGGGGGGTASGCAALGARRRRPSRQQRGLAAPPAAARRGVLHQCGHGAHIRAARPAPAAAPTAASSQPASQPASQPVAQQTCTYAECEVQPGTMDAAVVVNAIDGPASSCHAAALLCSALRPGAPVLLAGSGDRQACFATLLAMDLINLGFSVEACQPDQAGLPFCRPADATSFIILRSPGARCSCRGGAAAVAPMQPDAASSLHKQPDAASPRICC